MRIVVHCLVCNEERWIWYALKSVIDHVDEIMVWDTGSTDNTVEIIKSIANPKIKFKQVGKVDADGFTKIRQAMLKETEADWLMILDGDEVWPRKAIVEAINFVDKYGEDYEFSIRRYYSLVGDIYHYQEESGGQYRIGPYAGHINIRGVNLKKIPGLHFDKPHGQQGLFDENNILIQDRKPFKGKLMEERYFHFTHLNRSSTRSKDLEVVKRYFKYKYELGLAFPKDFIYPEVFYLQTPAIVLSPWDKRSFSYFINAMWQTPLKLIKRKLLKNLSSGY